MKQRQMDKTREASRKVIHDLRRMSDDEVAMLLGGGLLDALLRALLDPRKVSEFRNIAEFLLANKARSSLVAMLHYAITKNYAFKATRDGKTGFVSPHFAQWFEDGVMFTEGQKEWEGFVGLYRGGQLSFAVFAKDLRVGDLIDKEAFQFIGLDEFNKRLRPLGPAELNRLDEPLTQLSDLLKSTDNREGSYQELLVRYPWILGAQYEEVQRHLSLDDQNTPDFSAIRVHDRLRDVIEIKPPFAPIFTKAGGLTADFNGAWNQAERYLDFVRTNRDYLRTNKGLAFSPTSKCILLIGYGLSDQQKDTLRRKERLNPAIQLLTYDELEEYARKTVEFIRKLKTEASVADGVQSVPASEPSSG